MDEFESKMDFYNFDPRGIQSQAGKENLRQVERIARACFSLQNRVEFTHFPSLPQGGQR